MQGAGDTALVLPELTVSPPSLVHSFMQAAVRSSIHHQGQGHRSAHPAGGRPGQPVGYLRQGQRGGWPQALCLCLDLAALMNYDGVHGAAHSRFAVLLVLREGAGESVMQRQGGDIPSSVWALPQGSSPRRLGQHFCLKFQKLSLPTWSSGWGAQPRESPELGLPTPPPHLPGNGKETLSLRNAGHLHSCSNSLSFSALWSRGS